MTPLPQNLVAEASVVGGILLHSSAFNLVADAVSVDDFFHPTLRAIYAAMVALDASGKPIDQLTVAEQMRALDTYHKLRAFNGEAFFGELMNSVVTVENLPFHARMVSQKAIVRRIAEVGQELSAKGRGEYGDADEFIDGAERALFEVTQRTHRQTYSSVKAIMKRTITAIETRYERKQAITGVPTGFTQLDAITAGLQPCDLIIIAGRPSMGKTALVVNAVLNAALTSDGRRAIPGLIFSLEMSSDALMERLVCCEARVDSTRLRGGFLESRDWINITKAMGRIAEAPIAIDDSGTPTLLEIRAKARRWRSDPQYFTSPDQVGVIVIDYLQLVHGRPMGAREYNREREIAEISRGLKALAKELRCPVVALSQLNRGVESRADKRPMLSDLRESGSIEQDADVVAFIYRDEVYNKDSPDKGTAEVIIGKQRNGAIGTVRLAFLGAYTRFENLRRED